MVRVTSYGLLETVSAVDNSHARTTKLRRWLRFPVILRPAILLWLLPDDECSGANHRATVNRNQAGRWVDVERDSPL